MNARLKPIKNQNGKYQIGMKRYYSKSWFISTHFPEFESKKDCLEYILNVICNDFFFIRQESSFVVIIRDEK